MLPHCFRTKKWDEGLSILSSSAESLESLAWKVLFLHSKQTAGPEVCHQIGRFLDLVSSQLQKTPNISETWPPIEMQLQKLIVPILDNNYCFEAMRALAPLITSDVKFGPQFAWVPRALLLYSLPRGLAENDNDLSPKTMLTWLSRLCDKSPRGELSHVLFLLWSCDYDSDPRASQVKLIVAQRKLKLWLEELGPDNKFETLRRHIETEIADEDPQMDLKSALAEALILRLDCFWLSNEWRIACLERTLLNYTVDRCIGELDQDRAILLQELPESLLYWANRRMSEYYLRLAQVAADVASELVPNQETSRGTSYNVLKRAWEVWEHPEDLGLMMTAFESRLPVLEAVSLQDAEKELSTHSVPIQLQCWLLTKRVDQVGRIEGLFSEAFSMRLPLSDCQALLAAAQEFVEATNDDRLKTHLTSAIAQLKWTTAIFATGDYPPGSLPPELLREKMEGCYPCEQAAFVWEAAAVSGNYKGANQDRFAAVWDELCGLREDRKLGPKSSGLKSGLKSVVKTEVLWTNKVRVLWEYLALTVCDVRLASDRTFDANIEQLGEELLPWVDRSELICFLCLCCHIYCGSKHVPELLEKSSLKAVQLYSVAWALGGMERLWKVSRSQLPRLQASWSEFSLPSRAHLAGVELPVRVKTGAGSTGLLMLDKGPLQDLRQFAESYQAWEPLVSRGRRYIDLVAQVSSQTQDSAEAAQVMRTYNWADELDVKGDLSFILGPTRNVRNLTLGLGKLVSRLLGQHLQHAEADGSTDESGDGSTKTWMQDSKYAALQLAIERRVRGIAKGPLANVLDNGVEGIGSGVALWDERTLSVFSAL
ncbi:hypothetical protein GNI_029420 [Gregarina niphandrodes]|uniref:Uncharacterized protein n=1 Tax=Gregarina niphandrodes TaxID=110365 RepID=A0A023BBD3_GRENI|nr:hypothetical protein GNI_029420 [Gregarina niphandrodes]EZG79098.1 hypothetical protein GNI_029420 [Gregarina niphandrodes]|eukprot:XP_011129130.1 hypothetical protein GNI_029420 [Gregarina niphandrodes]